MSTWRERKVAGVLVETKAGRGTTFAAIVGIGVNINQRPEDFPSELRARAGSLAMALGRSRSADFASAAARTGARGILIDAPRIPNFVIPTARTRDPSRNQRFP